MISEFIFAPIDNYVTVQPIYNGAGRAPRLGEGQVNHIGSPRDIPEKTLADRQAYEKTYEHYLKRKPDKDASNQDLRKAIDEAAGYRVKIVVV